MTRALKRLVIIGVYIFLFLCVAFLIYLGVRPEKTCSDGKQNQNEEQIDCGGVCGACDKDYSDAQDLALIESHIVEGLPGTYDVVLMVENPNTVYGSPSFTYTVFLEDASGVVLSSGKEQGFILPTEKKYLLVTNLPTPQKPVHVRVEFHDATWQEFVNYEKPELVVVNKRYDLISDGSGYSTAFGLLKNNSPYDFNRVKVNIILKDTSGTILAVNRTERKSFDAFGEWDFSLTFSRAFVGNVDLNSGVIMEAETNMFDSQNFVKQYVPGGRSRDLQERRSPTGQVSQPF